MRSVWAAGDVIGVCLDLEKGQLSFVKNGVHLGGVPNASRSTCQHTVQGTLVRRPSVLHGSFCAFVVRSALMQDLCHC